MSTRPRVVVGMSGGVDSSVAAALLAEQGYDVVGVTMRLWGEARPEAHSGKQQCCSVEDIDDARRVAGQIGIRHYVINFEDAFRETVVDPFVADYAAGRTPNPCVRCNEHIKYRALFDKLALFDAQYLATGHYARVQHGEAGGAHQLLVAADSDKDQSYVLYMLGQEQVGRLLLPIGDVTKDQVRDHARRLGLETAEKPDSIEICFVPDGDYRNFVEQRAEMAPGEMRDASGTVVAEHRGIAAYTLGQRKGLGVTFGEPRYVTGIDPVANIITIGSEADLYTSTVETAEVTWVGGQPPAPGTKLLAKARYKAPRVPATLEATGPGTATVRFEEPQRALTPGQALALYDGDTVLGGGTIERAS